MSHQPPDHQDVPPPAQPVGSVLPVPPRRARRYLAAAAGLAGVASLAVVAGMSGLPVLDRVTGALGLPSLGRDATDPGGSKARHLDSEARTDQGEQGEAGTDDDRPDAPGWRAEWDATAQPVACDPAALTSALVTANAADGAKLTLARGCTYTLTLSQGSDGLPVITQPIAIKGDGATIVRAANSAPFRIFNVGPGGDLTLHGVTVTGGDARDTSGGGGLLVQAGGRATVEQSAVVGNRSATDGGGIVNHGITAVLSERRGGPELSTAEADRTTPDGTDGQPLAGTTGPGPDRGHDKRGHAPRIAENNAALRGGAIFSDGTLLLDGADVSGNRAGLDGGGVMTLGTAALDNSRISGNSAVYRGGGVAADSGAVTKLRHSSVTGNRTANGIGGGGGVYNGLSHLLVAHSWVSRNSAVGPGGGIWGNSGETVVEASEVSGNTTGDNGGGVFNQRGSLVLREALVGANRANGAQSRAGGVFNAGGDVRLTRTRVVGNDSVRPPGGIATDNNGVTVDDDSVIIDNRPTNCVGSPVPVPNCLG